MKYEEYLEKISEINNRMGIMMRERQQLREELFKQAHEEIAVGDGVTIRFWSDAHAGTVIKRTKKMIVVRRDKATLSPDFKPDFEIGGFCAHCTNQNDQTYTYEPDENGTEYRIFAGRDGIFRYEGKPIRIGRHEFYDYNF